MMTAIYVRLPDLLPVDSDDLAIAASRPSVHSSSQPGTIARDCSLDRVQVILAVATINIVVVVVVVIIITIIIIIQGMS